MLVQMDKLTLTHERIDDIPLLVTLGQTLQLDQAVDNCLGTHGLQQGLSNGQVTVVWLAYILSEGDHRKSGVEDWAWQHRYTLEKLLGCPLRRVDFSDDRLGRLLRRFSGPAQWAALENQLWRTSVQVYTLTVDQVRMDSTTTYGYHRIIQGRLMQRGYSKDHRPDLGQLKLMAAWAEPAGQWVASDIYPGQCTDDGLYVPLYQRVREMLGQSGLLYIGDGKMASLATRAQIAAHGDYYLTRMPHNLASAAQWQAWEEQRANATSMTLFWEAGALRGGGYEWEQELTAEVAGESVTWKERLQWVYSPRLAQQQAENLAKRLQQAEQALYALTPTPGRGKRALRDEATLQTRVTAILTQYQVTELLRPEWEAVEERQTHYVGRGRGSAQRATEARVRVHYRITHVERVTNAITAAQQELGWVLQISNAPVERLTLAQATQAYCGGWRVEHTFHQFKDRPVGVSPLFVWRNEQICGLTRLLTLALRLLTLIETQVAHGLQAAQQSLAGLYEGQPTRTTDHPSGKRLLKAVSRAEITLTKVCWDEHYEWHLTALPPWLPTVLAYLKLPAGLYENLKINSP